MKLIIASLLLVTCNLSLANSLAMPAFAREDLAHEINESDFINISKEVREFLSQDILSPDLTDKEIIEKLQLFLGPEFSFLSESIQVKDLKINNSHKAPLSSAQFNFDSSHSIHDLETYVKNRIGHGTYAALKKQNTKSIVIGGTTADLNTYLEQIFHHGIVQIQKLPCLYEKWGLSKYYVVNLTTKTTALIWIVPPSLQYVRHYAQLFAFTKSSTSHYFLDTKAQDHLETQVKVNAEKVLSKYKIDHIAFGYNSLWAKNISLVDSNWELKEQSHIDNLAFGASFKILTIQNKITGSLQNIALLASDQTVWGEIVPLHLKAFYNDNLKSVTFMGSAGSLSSGLNPYDISVPAEFRVSGQKINQLNSVQKIYGYSLPQFNNLVYWDSRHGHTYSPIQQNSRYLKNLLNKKIGTVDVEQSLVAATVENYNSTHTHQIKFNAINVVTDKPISLILKEKTSSDLDRLDLDQKAKARGMAVQLALMSILDVRQKIKCTALF